jgi:DNA-binding MarR family transcriptional regulator
MKGKFKYLNGNRLYQAISLRESLQTDGMGATEHRVLEVLARMMASRTVPGTLTVIDTCFPSLDTLAMETLFVEKTVRKAIDKLVDLGYITKSVIPGRCLGKRGYKSKYAGRRYHLVPGKWDVIQSPFAPNPTDEGRCKEFAASEAATSNSPDALVADAAVLDSLDTIAPDGPTLTNKPRKDRLEAQRVIQFIKESFPEHATCKNPNSAAMLSACADACIAEVGDADEALIVLQWALKDPAIASKVESAGKLGGYISACFPGWASSYPQEQEPVEADMGNPEDTEDEELREAPQEVIALSAYAHSHFSEHPSFSNPMFSEEDFQARLGECLEVAGTFERSAQVILCITSCDPKCHEQVMKCPDIGPYLQEHYPEWVKRYERSLSPLEQAPQTEIYDDDIDDDPSNAITPPRVSEEEEDDFPY